MKHIILMIITSTLLTLSSLAHAVIIRVDFQGSVNPTNTIPSDAVVSHGDIISGHLTYDTNATPLNIFPILGGNQAEYAGFQSVHIEGNGTILSSWVNNPATNEPNNNRYSDSAYFVSDVDSSSQDTVNFVYMDNFSGVFTQILFLPPLGDDSGSVINSINPPNPFPTNWLFDPILGSEILVWNGTITPGAMSYVTAKINTITVTTVPVPAAVWLFGSGMIGLVSIARRKAIQR